MIYHNSVTRIILFYDACQFSGFWRKLILTFKSFRNMKKACYGAIALLTPIFSFAHPGHEGGHDDNGYTIIHYFTQPTHAVISFGILFLTILIIRSLNRKDQKA